MPDASQPFEHGLRLLLLVMSLGLVFVLINEARDPRNWYWLTGEQDTVRPEAAADDIDTSYYPPPPPADSEEAIEEDGLIDRRRRATQLARAGE